MLTNAAAQVVWRSSGHAFSTSAGPSSIGMINLSFPGQYMDTESGLSYNWHRYFDPTVGRYTQSDPIGLAGGINTYAYADGNPISNIDPDGLDPTRAALTVGGAVAGGVTYVVANLWVGNDLTFRGFVGATLGGAFMGLTAGIPAAQSFLSGSLLTTLGLIGDVGFTFGFATMDGQLPTGPILRQPCP